MILIVLNKCSCTLFVLPYCEGHRMRFLSANAPFIPKKVDLYVYPTVNSKKPFSESVLLHFICLFHELSRTCLFIF